MKLISVQDFRIADQPGLTWLAALLAWLMGLHPAQAQTQSVRVQDISGQVHSDERVQISATQVRLTGKSSKEWPLSEIVRIDWRLQPESTLDDAPQLLLANGDRLGLRPLQIDEATLRARWERFPAWAEVSVPLETLRGVLLIPPRNPLERCQSLVKLRDQRESQDVFYLSNGDRLLGQLDRLENNSFGLTLSTGKLNVPVATVRGFAMNPDLTSFPPAKGKRVIVTLSDGSLLTMSDVTCDDKQALRGPAAFDPTLEFPVEHLVSVQFLGDRVVYLSELEPADFAFTPYLSRHWPLRRDQNAVGGPLRLAGREYARGIGLHSRSVVTYRLDKKFAAFQATLGIDAVAQGHGSVICRVLADGKPVFTSMVITGKSPPVVVGPLSMEDVDQLTLTVDFADHGDILDHANWCDALLIKQAG